MVDQITRPDLIDAIGKVGITRRIFAVDPAFGIFPENPARPQPVRRGGQPQHPQIRIALPHISDDALDGWRDAMGFVNDHQRIAVGPGALEGADPVLDGQGRPEDHRIAQLLGPGACRKHAGSVSAGKILAVVLHHQLGAGREAQDTLAGLVMDDPRNLGDDVRLARPGCRFNASRGKAALHPLNRRIHTGLLIGAQGHFRAQ